MAKKKVVEEVSEDTKVEAKKMSVAKLDLSFSREDLNLLAAKMNEIIDAMN